MGLLEGAGDQLTVTAFYGFYFLYTNIRNRKWSLNSRNPQLVKCFST